MGYVSQDGPGDIPVDMKLLCNAFPSVSGERQVRNSGGLFVENPSGSTAGSTIFFSTLERLGG